MSNRADLAIVGAGIMGLAHAYIAAERDLRVVVFERNGRASGASVRNFGQIWPVGQPAGRLHELALRSRSHWLRLLDAAGLPSSREGSLHVVYRADEADVAREFAELAPGLGYSCTWLDRDAVLERTVAVQPHGLIGALCSDTELTVDLRAAARSLTCDRCRS
jgi:glycine/D-amino acid oxidase-like deaminating enzyme